VTLETLKHFDRAMDSRSHRHLGGNQEEGKKKKTRKKERKKEKKTLCS
jgi:hypothetical protein